jgi:hypothetical protein
MNNWLKKYNRLSPHQRRLLRKVICEIIWISLNLRFRSFQNFKQWFSRSIQAYVFDNDHLLSEAILKVSTINPKKFTCLTQALTFKKMKGLEPDYKLIIGIQCNPSTSLDAHAWVEKSGQVLIGNVPDFKYTTLWIWE